MDNSLTVFFAFLFVRKQTSDTAPRKDSGRFVPKYGARYSKPPSLPPAGLGHRRNAGHETFTQPRTAGLWITDTDMNTRILNGGREQSGQNTTRGCELVDVNMRH